MKRKTRVVDTYSRLKARRREQGFSLMEILVVVVFLAVVGTVVVAAVLNSSDANSNASAAGMSQREMLDTTSAVSRDISTSTEILAAGDYFLSMRVNSGGTPQTVSYFYWNGKNGSDGMDDVAVAVQDRLEAAEVEQSDLPQFPAIMELRETSGKDPVVHTMIPGFQERSSSLKHLFSFYDGGGKDKMDTSSDANPNEDNTSSDFVSAIPQEKLSSIGRIEMKFAAQPSGRDTAMELATSVTPKAFLSGGTIDPESVASAPVPVAPVLSANLPAKEDVTNLSWSRVEGATGYTLYRDNRDQDVHPKVVRTYDRSTLETTDSDITWGENYSYYLVASGPGGSSQRSNLVDVTAVPPAPVLTGEQDDRTNNVSWEHVNGVGPHATPADSTGNSSGYKLYRKADDGSETLVYEGIQTSYSDSGRNFGDRTDYRVVPYNRGGDGFESDPLTLYTRPPATEVSANIPAKTSTATVDWAEAKNAHNGYTIHRSNRKEDDRQIGDTPQGTHTIDDSSGLKWGERYDYYVYSSNDGGKSNKSTIGKAYMVPPAPGISGEANGSTNTIEWTESNGVNSLADPAGDDQTGYKLYRLDDEENPVKIYEGQALSYADTGRSVGSSATYFVTPYNRGGDGFDSEKITLVSPPATPDVTVKDYTNGRDGNNLVEWNTPQHTKRFEYRRNGGSSTGKGMSTTTTDTTPGHDSKNDYQVRACNDSGCSGWGSATGLQPPGPFRITSSSQKMTDHSYVIGGANPENDDPQVVLNWSTSPGANAYSAKNGNWTRSKNSSRSLTQGRGGTHRLEANKIYTYKITAYGDTSELVRTLNQRVQTGPAFPREVRGRFYSEGGASEMTNARFQLHNGNAGDGGNSNGYRVEFNSGIVRGTGNTEENVTYEAVDGWKDWNSGSTIRSKKWAPKSVQGEGYGAMVFYVGRSTQQSGTLLPEGNDGSGWDRMYRTNGTTGNLMAFSMRTYGLGWGGQTGHIMPTAPRKEYQHTSSMIGYYRVMNGQQ